MILAFALAIPGSFASYANLRVILNGQAITAIAALALLMPLVGGRFDVSIGSNLAMSSIVAAAMMSRLDAPLLAAIAGGIASGCLIGLLNGILVAYLGVNSLIATLGVATVLGGLIQGFTGGTPIAIGIDPMLTSISVQQFFGIPLLALLMAATAVAAWFLITQTVFGRELTAIGVSLDASHLVGIRVRQRLLLSFLVAGGVAGVAGVLLLGRQGSGDPSVGGVEFILPALAAVFLGATAFHPGRYNVPGTILGVFFVGVAVSGLSLLGARPWVQPVFNGTIVIVAVAISQFAARRRTGTGPIGG